jgi:hypothetical protein
MSAFTAVDPSVDAAERLDVESNALARAAERAASLECEPSADDKAHTATTAAIPDVAIFAQVRRAAWDACFPVRGFLACLGGLGWPM